MNKDTKEFLPCPFCGEKDISIFYIPRLVRKEYGVHCLNCAAMISAVYFEKKLAIDAWNKRDLCLGWNVRDFR